MIPFRPPGPEKGPVLYYFHAAWCEPCKWSEPVVNEILNHFGSSMALQKIDIDLFPETARHLHVLSVPSFILFQNGNEVWRYRGFDASPVMIREMEKYI